MQMVSRSLRPSLIPEAVTQERVKAMNRIHLFAVLSSAAWLGDSVALAARELNNQRPTEVRTLTKKQTSPPMVVRNLKTYSLTPAS